MTTTFVAIPADRLLATLDEIGKKISDKGGRYTREAKKGSEIVAEFTLPATESRAEFITLKLYTSITEGAVEVRPSGEDAIRIVIGSISTEQFKAVRDSILVKRTAPNGIEDRVGAFLERLTLTLRDAYRFGLGVPVCECGHHMARREPGRDGGGKKFDPFWGCTTYPLCKKTKKI